MGLHTSELIADDMVKMNEHMERMLASDDRSMAEVIDWVLKQRGKQIRPQLTILSSRFSGKKTDVAEFAALVEIIHMASLVHDDIVDDSDMRRGILSVQKKFGKHMAVFTGDYMLFSAIANTTFKPLVRHRKMLTLIREMCSGEVCQFENLFNKNVTVEQYLKHIEGKTSALFRTACVIGAVEGRCDKKTMNLLSDFGLYFGYVFQLRDDLLDYLSTEKKEGKPIHNDILIGVYTLPLLYAFKHEKYGEETKQLVDMYIQKQDLKAGRRLEKLIREAGGYEYTIELLAKYKQCALDCLMKLPDIPERAVMQEILEYISKVEIA